MKTFRANVCSLPVPFVTLTISVGVCYSPTLLAYFNADDFSFLRFLYFNHAALVNGQLWEEWLIGGIVNYAVFRPFAHLLWLVNSLAFGLEPLGYHVVAALAHALVAYLVYLLAWLLTRERVTAMLAGLVFAVMPVHVEAVAWLAANYDVWCALFFLLGLIFYIVFQRQRRARFYWFALGAFALSISSREVALVFPLALVLYDLLYQPFDFKRLPRQVIEYAPFGVVALARLVFFGHGYRGLEFAPEGWLYYADTNLWRVFDPVFDFLPVRWVALGIVVALLVAYRWRAPVIFALAWIPLTLVPTLVGGVNDRSFYLASFAVALLLAMVCASLLRARFLLVRYLGALALVALLVLYGVTLFTRNQAYALASRTAQAIVRGVQEQRPVLPTNARLVFVGVPDAGTANAPVFGAGFWEALQIAYRDSSLRVYKFSQFPIWLDALDRTVYFQIDHRRVTERSDLLDALRARASCANSARVALAWDFSRDVQNWEAWNEMDELVSREGALVTRATGDDAFMGSPEFDLPALAIGDIEITMRVRAAQPQFTGEVYWQTADQVDFSPAFKQSFSGPADGAWHTYRVNLASRGTLLLGNRVTRLRFDPVATPAEIAIQSMRVYTHCESNDASRCVCAH